jgi:hypothetical protein
MPFKNINNLKENKFMKKVFLSVIIISLCFYFCVADVSDSLVSKWKFDENSGIILTDDLGNNNGTLIDGTWSTGKLGNALSFDGINDYVEIPDNDSLSFGDGSNDSPFTITAWINMNDATQFQIISKGNWFSNNKEFGFETHPQDWLYIALIDNSQSDAYIGRKYSAPITSYEGEWIHVSATYNGNGYSSGIKIY